ncbi:methionyl-tRNA formyltransferase [Achromobacter sp. B7]|jgi:methionyl-tRNA formyltransferase|uniref:formyltransferase family protein n=1 Tax=Achromobacter sp. B7 TaxID=2282475 RepID=UPI000E7185CC|nr:formyltransferase family protein [Achromobacter sp. B7]AYD67202.1 methionyl-tRNA formyltransferase [Achromobacter sp. B7]
MRLNRVLLLAAHTARSQAYIQTLVARDLLPASVILLAPPENVSSRQARPQPDMPGLILPDLEESVTATCARTGIPVVELDTRDVNSSEVAAAMTAAQTDVVIYSGYGGQIVSDHLLALGPVFLHMHSGWLPAYRGSTTLYYALLNGDPPAVSALLLDKHIDTGPVVARREYPKPPAGIDVDSVYDAAIRADLLAHVLKDYAASGELSGERQQVGPDTSPYYVIHPVLKHLALLSLAPQPSEDG